jgi:hypothetical protein
MTPDERANYLVELATIVPLDEGTRAEIVTTMEQAPQLLPSIMANYASQDWTDPATPAGQRFLKIVEAFGAVGSAAGNVIGAISGAKGV